MAIENYTIDATGRTLGRVASETADCLTGKNRAAYDRSKAPTIKVKIVNASKFAIAPKKLKEKLYHRHSGYPGGLTTETMKETIARLGYKEIFRKAVYGMLPKNKLRAIMIKNLTITD